MFLIYLWSETLFTGGQILKDGELLLFWEYFETYFRDSKDEIDEHLMLTLERGDGKMICFFFFREYFWRCEWIKSRKRYCWVISMSSYGRHSDVKVIACGRHGGWCWDTCRRHYDDVLHYVKDGWGTENNILKVLYIFTGVKSKIKMMRNSEKGSGWWRFLAFVIGNLLFDFVLIGVVWGFRPLSLSIRCWGGRWRWLGQLWWLAKGFPVPTFSKARARVLRF